MIDHQGQDPSLINPDIAPVPPENRTWSKLEIASLWVGMAVCIPTYTIASSLLSNGFTWWQAVLTVFLGNLIVLVPMTLNAHPGTAYGLPFPVLLRASFGIRGANIAALLRGVVACGWFGIQTWMGGAAIYSTLGIIFGESGNPQPLPWLGISIGQFMCFMIFWAINVYFIIKGMESIKWLEVFSAPFLLLVGLALVIWALSRAGSFAAIFAGSSQSLPLHDFLPAFGAGLTAMVGFWATLSLNIPDFSRYARSQRDQVIGQAIGLPPTMTLYSFIGIVVTGATLIIFGETIWDPVQVISRMGSKPLSLLALVAIAIATLSTNIAANVVSPANDFSNLAPQHINFRTGGLITAFIGIAILPWKLVADPNGYIFTWLIGYSALLGPIAGIMIADYFILRRRHLSTADLYRSHGIYRYTHGFSLAGLTSFLLAVLPNLPGFLVQIGTLDPAKVPDFLETIYRQAWFVGFTLGFILYLLFRRLAPTPIHAS